MAKKQTPQQPLQKGRPLIPAQKPQPRAQAATDGNDKEGFVHKYATHLIMAGIALVTYIFYKGSLENKFTNWDDLGYVLTNPLIKDSSSEGFWRLFNKEALVMGNYHPLTIATYWYEYGKYGLEPHMYHVHSLLLHILCTFAVVGFIRVLTRNYTVALLVGLLFALHPMRVESVTWIAGRKDLLYGMFFMLACTTHLYYIRNQAGKKTLWYVATIVLFLISLLSKSVGVTLPVVLLLLDYYEDRKLDINLILEKLPLFALSVAFGLMAVYAQTDVGALGTLEVHFNPIERLALGCYALITYVWKAIIPVGLTNFYPHPMKISGSLPLNYYLYMLLLAGMLFGIWRFGRKNKTVVLGVSFFIINMLLLLQFISVGGAIIADRYTYISYIGLFLMAAVAVAKYMENNKPMANVILGVSVALCLGYGYMTNERNKDWYDSLTLWNDAIEKNPRSPLAYFLLGQEYYTRFEASVKPQEKQKNGDSAFYYFTKSVEMKPDYASAIVSQAEYLRSVGRIDESKVTYLRALSYDKTLKSAYMGLGVVYSIKQQYDSAGPAFRKALALKDFFPECHSNYANYLDILGKTDSALFEYEKSIIQNPDVYIPHMNRGRIYLRINKPQLALEDYNRANIIEPDNPEPYYMRAKCYAAMGKKADARREVEEARKRGFQVEQAFYDSLL
jgi:tetratricopeptide (TPR) repeat protein